MRLQGWLMNSRISDDTKRQNIKRLLQANTDIITDFVLKGEVVSILPSRSGGKLLHNPKALRDGFVRVEFSGVRK